MHKWCWNGSKVESMPASVDGLVMVKNYPEDLLNCVYALKSMYCCVVSLTVGVTTV